MDDFEIIRQLGKDGAQGVVHLVEFPNGLRCAMKQFKPKKSIVRIQMEADLQRQAAAAGISPNVMHVDTEKRRIFMEPMQIRIVDVLEQSNRRFEQDLSDIMDKLDDLKILHNDGNALNLMLDNNDKLCIIDFGLAKKINKKLLQKWGPHPNTAVTLFMLRKQLAKYNIRIK